VIDDLIVYYINDQHCRLVTNASTREKDGAWLLKQASGFDVAVEERADLALIAVQGPEAVSQCSQLLESGLAAKIAELNRFQGAFIGEQFVGRTGYTGEDGVELIVAETLAPQLWATLIEGGIQPCGLGARDTLRLEAGMSLYGNDLDEQHSPFESGLAWTVSLDSERDFIGMQALTEPAQYNMVGLILLDRGVLRGHQTVHLNDQKIGEITSGTFSPTLEKSIALARVDANAELSIGSHVQIAMRNKFVNAQIARYPFVKNGTATN